MEPPPPPYTETVVAVSDKPLPVIVEAPPMRIKKYKIVITIQPNFAACDERLLLEATQFFSFLCEELQYDAHDNFGNVRTDKILWDKFFKEKNRPGPIFSIMFANDGQTITWDNQTNFKLSFEYTAQKLSTGGSGGDVCKYVYACVANFPLSTKRKR